MVPLLFWHAMNLCSGNIVLSFHFVLSRNTLSLVIYCTCPFLIVVIVSVCCVGASLCHITVFRLWTLCVSLSCTSWS